MILATLDRDLYEFFITRDPRYTRRLEHVATRSKMCVRQDSLLTWNKKEILKKNFS